MPDRRLPSYPPVGEPERLDAIMVRGRSLRRRRQLSVGAGAGGGALAVVFALALVVGTGNGTQQLDTAGTDDPDPTTAPTTAAPTTTTLPDQMVVEIVPEVGARTVDVNVVDPEQPDLDDAKQCLTVTVRTLEGTTVATGWGCNDGPGDSTAAPLPLLPTDTGVEISPCAVSIEPEDPDAVEPGTRPARTTFQLLLADLGPGTYELEVSATSGTGDGCAASDEPSREIENVAESTSNPLMLT